MTQVINWKSLSPLADAPLNLPEAIAGIGPVRLMQFEGKPFAVALLEHRPDGVAESVARRAAYTTLGQVKDHGLAALVSVCDGSSGLYTVYVGTPIIEDDEPRSVVARLSACANHADPRAFEEALREHILEALDTFAKPFGKRGWVDQELPELFGAINVHAIRLGNRIATKNAFDAKVSA
jgi:hypothetical protein